MTNAKVTQEHLSREAVVYIRQSSPEQIRSNRESGRRQYGLVERATSLAGRLARSKLSMKTRGDRAPVPLIAMALRNSWPMSVPARWGWF